MFKLFLISLFLILPCKSWAYITAGYVPVVKTSSSSGVSSTSQNGSIFDTGTSSGAGNVGIGSTNPGQALDVKGTVRSTAFIAGTGSATITGDANGNVGINQASPGAKLDVNGSLKMTAFQLTTSPTNNYVLTSHHVQ